MPGYVARYETVQPDFFDGAGHTTPPALPGDRNPGEPLRVAALLEALAQGPEQNRTTCVAANAAGDDAGAVGNHVHRRTRGLELVRQRFRRQISGVATVPGQPPADYVCEQFCPVE